MRAVARKWPCWRHSIALYAGRHAECTELVPFAGSARCLGHSHALPGRNHKQSQASFVCCSCVLWLERRSQALDRLARGGLRPTQPRADMGSASSSCRRAKLDKHGRLHKQAGARKRENGAGMDSFHGSEIAGLLRVTIKHAHVAQRGYYNVTLSMGLQVRAVPARYSRVTLHLPAALCTGRRVQT